MATIDVISWQCNKSELCYRYNSDNIKDGATLVVHESQAAFFVEGGAIKYVFEDAGSHILSTENMPFLNSLRNVPYGGATPTKAEVWFVNRVSIPGLRWGTPTPILLEDPTYKIIVPVTAYGKYGLRITDARLFLESLIGNMSNMPTNSISDDVVKPYIIQGVSEILSKQISSGASSILNISNELSGMSELCRTELNKYVKKFGLVVTDFNLMAISATEDSLQRLSDAKMRAAEIKIIGEAEKDYTSKANGSERLELWDALIGGKEVSDLTSSAIVGLIMAKIIDGNTMIRRQNSMNEGWYRVCDIKEFAVVL